MKEKQPMHRVMISIPLDDYNYCKSHFIKISPLCEKAVQSYIKEMKDALASLKKDIPPLVDIPEGNTF